MYFVSFIMQIYCTVSPVGLCIRLIGNFFWPQLLSPWRVSFSDRCSTIFEFFWDGVEGTFTWTFLKVPRLASILWSPLGVRRQTPYSKSTCQCSARSSCSPHSLDKSSSQLWLVTHTKCAAITRKCRCRLKRYPLWRLIDAKVIGAS